MASRAVRSAVTPKKRKASTPIASSPDQEAKWKRRDKTSPKSLRKTKRESERTPPAEEFWQVQDIICEAKLDGVRHLLVIWVGTDPSTGLPWDHSYEPATGIGAVLRRGWNLKKASISQSHNVKAREEAARKTIHWYLAESSIDTAEYHVQVAAGTHLNSLLAQESPWYISADFPCPEVKRYRPRTIHSSPELDSSSRIPSPTSQSCLAQAEKDKSELDNSEVGDSSSRSLTSFEHTLSQIETALCFDESPSRSQLPEIHLPPLPSQPERYQFVSESQLPRSSSLGLLGGTISVADTAETDSSDLISCPTPASSVQEVQFVPDSQSFREDPLNTQSPLKSSLSPTVSSRALQESGDDPTEVPSSPDSRSNPKHNSLGFTQSSCSAQSKIETDSVPRDSIEGESWPFVSNISILSATRQNSTGPYDQEIGEFASQIPYIQSQRTTLTSSCIQSHLDIARGDFRNSWENTQTKRFTTEEKFGLDSALKTLSQTATSTLSSLPRAPSKSPDIFPNSLPPPRQDNPLPCEMAEEEETQPAKTSTPSMSQGSVSSLRASRRSPDRGETITQRYARKRREIYAARSVVSSQSSALSSVMEPQSVETSTEDYPAIQPVPTKTSGLLEEPVQRGTSLQEEPTRPISVQSSTTVISNSHEGQQLGLYLSLPFEQPAREVYESILSQEKNLLDDLEHGRVTIQSSSPDLATKLSKITDRLFQACSHLDLVENSPEAESESEMGQATQLQWSISMSSKCAFLESLFRNLSEASSGEVIYLYAKPGQTMDILETLLRQLDLTFSRKDKNVYFDREHNFLISLIPTGLGAESKPADLAIGFDETFDPRLEKVRYRSNPTTACPYLCLVVHHSIEHMWRVANLAPPESPFASLLGSPSPNLLLTARSYVEQAGVSGPDDLRPKELGEQAAALFLEDKLGEMPSIFEYEVSVQIARARNIDIQATSHDRSGIDSRKRPISEITEHDHGSNSSKRLRPALNSAEVNVIDENSRATETLREELLQSLEMELGKLQSRFEQQSRENHVLQTALDTEKNTVTTLSTRVAKQSTTISELRAERTTLQSEIASIHQAISGAGDGNETAKRLGELGEKAARVDALEKKQESSRKELEFVRQNYQEASAAAKEHADEAADLRNQNVQLTHKASDQATKLRTLFVRSSTEAYKEENKQLKAEKAHSDRVLRDAQAEILHLKERLELEERRAGMSLNTRSSSMPLQDVPSAAMAARLSSNLAPLAAKGGSRGTVSANTSRAPSPAAGSTRWVSKTSPLQKAVVPEVDGSV